ncbi:hypothetical protein [Candidatus Neptunochlamydia vexilliferae]|uniref:Uncharacterized protein n=1 Tax=Candidatus Neptunichlamydia vexilliferae TaxID=1651774 RepID=A0ABS0AZU3_9BACT|nr:hypothetical protein [Candidatus Neptunochlamydia vexilliferae]MBF5058855.1 hypothetical protein [Candidatus Neptunochlamydia vexilliferae]
MVLVDRTLPSRDLDEPLKLARLEDARACLKKLFKIPSADDRDLFIEMHNFQRTRHTLSFMEQMEIHKAYEEWYEAYSAYAGLVEAMTPSDYSLRGILKEFFLSIGDLFTDEREKLHKARVTYFEVADQIQSDEQKAITAFSDYFETDKPVTTLKEVRDYLKLMNKRARNPKLYREFRTRYFNEVKLEAHWNLDYVFQKAIKPPKRSKRAPLLLGQHHFRPKRRVRPLFFYETPLVPTLLSIEQSSDDGYVTADDSPSWVDEQFYDCIEPDWAPLRLKETISKKEKAEEAKTKKEREDSLIKKGKRNTNRKTVAKKKAPPALIWKESEAAQMVQTIFMSLQTEHEEIRKLIEQTFIPSSALESVELCGREYKITLKSPMVGSAGTVKAGGWQDMVNSRLKAEKVLWVRANDEGSISFHGDSMHMGIHIADFSFLYDRCSSEKQKLGLKALLRKNGYTHWLTGNTTVPLQFTVKINKIRVTKDRVFLHFERSQKQVALPFGGKGPTAGIIDGAINKMKQVSFTHKEAIATFRDFIWKSATA